MNIEKATPGAIFSLATRNPIVHAAVSYWRQGGCTWEQALIHMVLLLEGQNKHLLETAVSAMERSTEKQLYVIADKPVTKEAFLKALEKSPPLPTSDANEPPQEHRGYEFL